MRKITFFDPNLHFVLGIAKVNLIMGPYCGFIPAIVYSFTGSSPHASVSSGAVAALLIAQEVDQYDTLDERSRVASLLALFTGVTLILMSFLKMSFLVRFLSMPTLSGFITGAALLIGLNQAKHFLGVAGFIESAKFFPALYSTVIHIPDSNWIAVFMGSATIFTINFLKDYKDKHKNPTAAVEIFLVNLAKFKEPFVCATGIIIIYVCGPIARPVGFVPQGLPPFNAPWENLPEGAHWHKMILPSILLAFTSFITSFAASRSVAMRAGYTLNPRQELFGLGMAGLVGSFFHCFPISGSLSRTAIAYNSGVKTQLGGLIAALTVGICLVFLPDVLCYLPRCVLAGLIINAARGLIEFKTAVWLFGLMRRWRDKADFAVWFMAFFCTLWQGVLYGIVAACLLSLLLLVKAVALPETRALGRIDKFHIWRDVKKWSKAREIPGVLVFEMDGPLFFGNAQLFRDNLAAEVERKTSESKVPISAVVIQAASMVHLDASGVQTLSEIFKDFKARDIVPVIASVKGSTRELLQQEVKHMLPQETLFLSLDKAVEFARKKHLGKQITADLEEGLSNSDKPQAEEQFDTIN